MYTPTIHHIHAIEDLTAIYNDFAGEYVFLCEIARRILQYLFVCLFTFFVRVAREQRRQVTVNIKKKKKKNFFGPFKV